MAKMETKNKKVIVILTMAICLLGIFILIIPMFSIGIHFVCNEKTATQSDKRVYRVVYNSTGKYVTESSYIDYWFTNENGEIILQRKNQFLGTTGSFSEDLPGNEVYAGEYEFHYKIRSKKVQGLGRDIFVVAVLLFVEIACIPELIWIIKKEKQENQEEIKKIHSRKQ